MPQTGPDRGADHSPRDSSRRADPRTNLQRTQKGIKTAWTRFCPDGAAALPVYREIGMAGRWPIRCARALNGGHGTARVVTDEREIVSVHPIQYRAWCKARLLSSRPGVIDVPAEERTIVLSLH